MAEEVVGAYFPCEVTSRRECYLHKELEHKCAFDTNGRRTGCDYAIEFAKKLMYRAWIRGKIEILVDTDEKVILRSGREEVVVERGHVGADGRASVRLEQEREKERD